MIKLAAGSIPALTVDKAAPGPVCQSWPTSLYHCCWGPSPSMRDDILLVPPYQSALVFAWWKFLLSSCCCLGFFGSQEKESGRIWLFQAVTAWPGTGTDNNTLGYLHFLATNDTGLPAKGSTVQKETWESMSEFPLVLELLGSL